MKIVDTFRRCDKFGAQVEINFMGKGSHGTMGGGVASLCLSALVLTYLVMRF